MDAQPEVGFGTYERARGPRLLERLTTSGLYVDCMTDFSHPEPTAWCVSALARFGRDYPVYEARRVEAAIAAGVRHLRSCQRADGSYRGSWGINFTYGRLLRHRGTANRGRAAVRPGRRRSCRLAASHAET